MWRECPHVPGQNDLGTTDGDLCEVFLVPPAVAMAEKSQWVGQRPVERRSPQSSESWEPGQVHVLSRSDVLTPSAHKDKRHVS